MSGKIEVGCWAVVYKAYPCCGYRSKSFGTPFIVQAIEPKSGGCCKNCGSYKNIPLVKRDAGNNWSDIDCVKRIDPPSESESQETKESLHA